MTEEQAKQLYRVTGRMTDAQVKKKLLPAYRESLDNIRKEIGRLYEKYAVGGVVSRADVTKYNRLIGLEKNVAEELARLTGKEIRVTTGAVKDIYMETYYRTAFIVEGSTEWVDMGFSQLPTKQVEASILNPMDRIKWPDRSRANRVILNRQIQETITQGLIQGHGYPEMVRNIKKRMDIGAGRAERILRTETHRAQTMGQLDAYQYAEEVGVDFTYIWTATIDDGTRDLHADMDGRHADTVVDNRPMWSLPDGVTTEGPGLTGLAHHDVRCRCIMRAEVKGYEPGFRRVKESQDLVPYQSYNQWYNARIIN